MTRYAEGTTVQPENSQQEISRILRRYGAEGFMFGWEHDQAAVMFSAHSRRVRFVLTIPTDIEKYRVNARRGRRTDTQAQAALDAEVRRLWRCLALAIKAKLEVVESGIATFGEEFLAHIVLPDGSTVGDRVTPELDRAYQLGTAPKSMLAIASGT